ncbi:hypothetical protein [Microvirga sp. P5_D2]
MKRAHRAGAGLETALALAQEAEFDVAVLDLNGMLSYPVAEVICGRRIPSSSQPGTVGLDCDRT